MLQTRETEKYSTFWMSTVNTNFEFTVRACYGVYIGLSASKVGNYDYEVIIGHDTNTNSTVWEVSESGERKLLASAERSGLLNCWEPRLFWVSWKEGNIRVARLYQKGSFGTDDVFLDTSVTTIRHVTSLSLSTPADVTGDYEFSQFQGEFLTLTFLV
jgi:hypothetical protein